MVLDTLPSPLLGLVSRFVMPCDANCLVRSFNGVDIDWMKVLFNYARVEALHTEWCIAVHDLRSAKAFYVNHKEYDATDTDMRALAMCVAIKTHNLPDFRRAIIDCPRLFRQHKFALHDSVFPYIAKVDNGTAMTSGLVIKPHGVSMAKKMTDGSILTDHRAVRVMEFLDFHINVDEAFKQLVCELFASYRQYMATTSFVDACMMNLNSRTAIIDLPKLLFEGELYGSASSVVPNCSTPPAGVASVTAEDM